MTPPRNDFAYENVVSVSKSINKMVEDMGIEYIEACILYCEKNDMDPEQLADIIKQDQNLQANIQVEAEDLHFIPRTPRLAFKI